MLGATLNSPRSMDAAAYTQTTSRIQSTRGQTSINHELERLCGANSFGLTTAESTRNAVASAETKTKRLQRGNCHLRRSVRLCLGLLTKLFRCSSHSRK